MSASAPMSSPPTLGPPGEPCPTCGAVLAADQRYCLNCGTRRAESRVPFPAALTGGGAAVPAHAAVAPAAPAAASPAARPAGKRSWADRDLVLPVAGTALLAIAVGILIGRSGASDTITTKAPIVNVAPSAAAAAPAAAAAATDTTADTSAGSGSGSGSKKTKAAKDSAKSSTANVSKNTLSDNAKASGKDYVNKSKKLPTTIGTGGTAPPKDDKAPGGGSGGGGDLIQ